MTLNVKNIEDRMQLMHDNELQQFAAMHKNDPYILPLALQEAERRRKAKVAQGMQYVGQQQPTVADQAVQRMQPTPAPALPEDQGIATVPAQNIVGMADGGIAGYADGDRVVDTSVYRKYAIERARAAGLNPRFVDSLFRVESSTKKHPEGYDPHARSKTGPAGIGQLTKATARAYGLSPEERFNPYKNIDASIAHLSDLHKKYRGDERKVAVAYNQGEPFLNAHLRKNKGQLNPAALEKEEPKKYLERISKLSVPPPNQGIARLADKFLPFASAQAAEAVPVPRVAAAEVPVIPEDKRSNTLVGKVNGPPVYRAAPVQASASPGLLEKVVTVPEESESMFQLRQIEDPNAVRRPATQRIEPNFLGQAATHLLGAPEAALGVATGMVSPWTAAVPYGLSKLAGQDKSYEEAMRNATFSPRSKAGLETLDTAYDVLDASKLPPYMPGIPSRPMRGKKPLFSEAEQGQRMGRLAAAEKNIERSQKGQMELPLEPGGSVEGAAKDATLRTRQQNLVDQAMRAEAERNATDVRRAEGAQASLFPAEMTPVPPELNRVLKPRNPLLEMAQLEHEKRSNVRAGIEELRAKGEEARARERAVEKRKAGEGVAAGELQLERQAKDRNIAEEIARTNALRDRQAEVLGLAGVGTRVAQEAAAPAAVDASVARSPAEAWEENFTAPETNYGTVEPTIPEAVKAESEKLPPAEAKKSPGLSDEDYLTMGLHMLQSGPQVGNVLQDLASNVGRSGLATLAARKEREKTAAEQAFKDVYGKYYTKLAENLGKPQGEERIIERYMTDPTFAAAVDASNASKNNRLNMASLVKVYEESKMFNPAYKDMTFQQWLQLNGINGEQSANMAINPAVMPLVRQYANPSK